MKTRTNLQTFQEIQNLNGTKKGLRIKMLQINKIKDP